MYNISNSISTPPEQGSGNFKILHNRSGYTLVELVVVMGIMALMMLLSASAFLMVRDQFTVDQTAEELLSTIREAQNKSISVSENSNGEKTKVWGVELKDNGFRLVSLNPNGQTLISRYETGNLKPNPGVTLSYNNTDPTSTPSSTTSANSVYVYYATPFGTPFLAVNEGCVTGFVASGKLTEEWAIKNACSFPAVQLTSPKYATIVLSKNNHFARVTVKANGDAYIEK